MCALLILADIAFTGAHMKLTSLSLTLITALASITARAETDNFNMALTGDVVKQYCSISTPLTNWNFGTFDVTALDTYTDNSLSIFSGKIVDERDFQINCDAGTTFQISNNTPASGQGLDVGNNIQLIFEVSDVATTSGYDEINESISKSLTGTGNDDQYFIRMSMAPSNGVWDDVGDSLSTTVSWTITTN